jgi:hypothetical protein
MMFLDGVFASGKDGVKFFEPRGRSQTSMFDVMEMSYLRFYQRLLHKLIGLEYQLTCCVTSNYFFYQQQFFISRVRQIPRNLYGKNSPRKQQSKH